MPTHVQEKVCPRSNERGRPARTHSEIRSMIGGTDCPFCHCPWPTSIVINDDEDPFVDEFSSQPPSRTRSDTPAQLISIDRRSGDAPGRIIASSRTVAPPSNDRLHNFTRSVTSNMRHASYEIGRAGQKHGKKGYTDKYTIVPNIHAWVLWSHLYRGVECIATGKELQTVELTGYYSRDSPDQTEEDWIRHIVRPHLTNPIFSQAFKENWKIELAKNCTKKGPTNLPFPSGPIRTIRDLFHPPSPIFRPDGYKPIHIYVCFYAPLDDVEEEFTPRIKKERKSRTKREDSAEDTITVKEESIEQPLVINNDNFIDASSPYEKDSFKSTVSPLPIRRLNSKSKRPRADSDQSIRTNKKGRTFEEDMEKEIEEEIEENIQDDNGNVSSSSLESLSSSILKGPAYRTRRALRK
ncbi:hypothetical protein F5Y11DRAFT_346474 [Daldinia sp. FL1419]|nr:hypothetical protein F5Y11DRAFT_346474 [Daldinia sp. FL1419]